MDIATIKHLFTRDIDKVKAEIEGYADESKLWIVDKNISNSAGNLCLHICGNLQHFIGNKLGGSDYQRNREAEFNDKNIPISTLLQELQTSKEVVEEALSKITYEDLQKDDPKEYFIEPVNVGQLLLYLYGHLSYHLGQINYHRRLLS